jgi:RHS repeat-associated protein
VARTYTYGFQRISQNSGAATPTAHFYVYDGHGSVRSLTDAAAAVTDTYEYDAFGNLVAGTGSTPNHNLYAGEHFDVDLGLYYLRARWYRPTTGRFLTRDKYEGTTKTPSTLHLYAYAAGDPANKIDPTGNDFFFGLSRLAMATRIRAIDFVAKNAAIIVCVDAATLAFAAGEISNAVYQAWITACRAAALN